MKQYLEVRQGGFNNSFKRDFDLLFKRLEFLLFIIVSIGFLVAHNLNKDFPKKISTFFVDISIPVAKFAASPINITISLLTDFNDLVGAKNENEALKEEISKLRNFYIKSLYIHQENKELREILEFNDDRGSNFHLANIISVSHQTFNKQVFIDSGSDSGIKQSSMVLGKNGVIGRISEVLKDKSRLILITDSNSHIPIITSKSRVRGILAGNGRGAMKILYLNRDHKIEEGERVFTSGDGNILVPGLLVGIVKKVDQEKVLVVPSQRISDVNIATIVSYDGKVTAKDFENELLENERQEKLKLEVEALEKLNLEESLKDAKENVIEENVADDIDIAKELQSKDKARDKESSVNF